MAAFPGSPYHVGMKKLKPKKVRTIKPQPAVKAKQSKPKVKLSKSDPDYFKKIGLISAKKRKMTPEQFSAMAKKSHAPTSKRDGYHGGRKKKDGGTDSKVA